MFLTFIKVKEVNMFKKNPLNLIIVAFIFLLIGLYGLYDALVTSFTERHLYIDLGLLLGIPVFWGLLKHRKGWRTLALFFIWVEMIGSAVGFIPVVLIISVSYTHLTLPTTPYV